MRRLVFLAGILLIGLGGAGAHAAAPSGTAVGVNPEVQDVARTTRTLVVGADVAMGDRIVTGATGQAQIIFTDDTHLVVGPGSSLVIESYLLRGQGSAGKFAIDALGGTYRFITGRSDHSAYTINTPAGTIGVRGTAFDFIVSPRRAVAPQHRPGMALALFRGAVEVCDLAGRCVVVSRTCDLVGADTAGVFTMGNAEAVAAGMRQRFRYIASERPLLSAFRIPQSRGCYIDSSPPATLATPITGGNSPLPPRGRPRR